VPPADPHKALGASAIWMTADCARQAIVGAGRLEEK